MQFFNPKHADIYEGENSDNIIECHAFDTEADYNAYSVAVSTVVPDTNNSVSAALSPEQNSALLRMKRYRIQNSPTRSFSIHYKNTMFSQAVVLFFDILDYKGQTQFTFKITDFKTCMSAYVNDEFFQASCPHTQEIINNLEILERRDKEKGENDIDKNSKGYVQYKAASFFVLPKKPEINSMELEETYIRTSLQAFGSEMIAIMSTNLYTISLKEHISSYSTSWAALVCHPNKGPSLQEFVKSCSVTINPVRNYTDFIVKDKVHVVRNMLAMHDNPIPKYIDDKNMLDHESDGEASVVPVDDDDDNENEEQEGAYAPKFNINGGDTVSAENKDDDLSGSKP